MKGEERQISIDQFYADKLKGAEINLDIEAGWNQFEVYEKQQSSFLFKLWASIFVLLVFGIICITIIIKNSHTTESLLKDESLSSNITSPGYHDNPVTNNTAESGNNMDEKFDSNENFDDYKVSKELTVTNKTRSKMKNLLPNMGLEKNDFSDSEFIKSNDDVEANTTYTYDERGNLISADEGNSGRKNSEHSLLMDNNDLGPVLNFEVDEESVLPDINNGMNFELPFGSSLSPVKYDSANVNNEWNVSIESANRIVGNENLGLRKELEMDLLTTKFVELNTSNSFELGLPVITEPLNSNPKPKWFVDIGLTFGKEYELNESFDLDESGTKVRLAHFATGFDHLQSRLFDTYAYFSYDKIYSESEFVGDRIVRTYQDDNFSLGYGFRWNITSRLSLESSMSLGVSFIDKIEYEQKPIFVGGTTIYEDYTESSFKMDPTLTYQNHTKLSYRVFDKVNFYVGTAYRSQFANQLSSATVARENTLSTFSDTQFIAGIRYYLN